MSDDRPSNGPAEDDGRTARDRDTTTDAVDRDGRDSTETAAGRDESVGESATKTRPSPDRDPDSRAGTGDDGGSGRGWIAFAISALIGLVLAVGSVLLVTGRAPFFEDLLRVRPTVQGGGVAADWVFGNTALALEIAIAVVHFADVLMGIFILLMVFIHWAAFRRLAARMRPPSSSARGQRSTTATDGGEPSAAAEPESEPVSKSDGDDPTRSDGGAPR